MKHRYLPWYPALLIGVVRRSCPDPSKFETATENSLPNPARCANALCDLDLEISLVAGLLLILGATTGPIACQVFRPR